MFEPLWRELDRRHAVVFEHPGATPGQPILPSAAGIALPMADILLETTRTALQFALRGSLTRYPNVNLVPSHAGGFLTQETLLANVAEVA
jgi:6-methylsalicylate decarboxylase